MSTLHGNWLPLHKVSVERIGIEVLKMLLGNDPERAFAMLLEYGLLQMVLKPGTMDTVILTYIFLLQLSVFTLYTHRKHKED